MKKCVGLIPGLQLLIGISAFAQDEKNTAFKYDSLLSVNWTFPKTTTFTKFYFDASPTLLNKDPDANDSLAVRLYSYLVNSDPSAYNYEEYASLASALREFDRIEESEKMLRTIIQSNDSFYTYTMYHSSGTSYGYGSYTTNYKHNACLTLAKILIEKKKYREALNYVKAAELKYKVYYTCGTGNNAQQRRFRAYYSLCYQGAGMIDEGIRLLLPFALDGEYEGLIYFLKKKYSKAQIKKYMDMAYQNINGTATTILFGSRVSFPYIWLEDGEVITKKHFQDAFKNSRLYEELVGEESVSGL